MSISDERNRTGCQLNPMDLHASVSVNTFATNETIPVKRGRGRPRLTPVNQSVGEGEKKEKRGRGRPRLKPLPSPVKQEIEEDFPCENTNTEDDIECRKTGRYSCVVCSVRFRSRNKLLIHESTHEQLHTTTADREEANDVLSYVCSVCGKQFPQRAGLVDHTRVHSNARPHECGICGKSFARVGHMRCHMRIHSGERPHMCDQCGRAFTMRSDLRRHKDVVHAGVRSYVCTTCGKACSGMTGLVYHRRTHTGEKPYVCVVCGHAFAQSGTLREHGRIHTGEKPYACETCGRAFSTKRACNLHQGTHDGLKTLLCGECGRAFNRHSTLLEHQKTHTGARPYPCPCCQRAFAKKSTRKAHMVRKHESLEGEVATARAPSVSDATPNMVEVGISDSPVIDSVGVANKTDDIAEILLGISSDSGQFVVSQQQLMDFGVDMTRLVEITGQSELTSPETILQPIAPLNVEANVAMDDSLLVMVQRTNDTVYVDNGVSLRCIEVTTDGQIMTEDTLVHEPDITQADMFI